MICMSVGLKADDISVTVYNSNLGVISENRTFDFNKGTNRLEIKDIPSQLDAGSVRFELNESGKSISILEQNYAYDLVSHEKMYARYIDENIELIGKDGQISSGTLLSYGGGAVTLLMENGQIKIVQLSNILEINFPALPDGLITRPTLFWKYNSDFNGSSSGKFSYQTAGLSWLAEYVGVLSSKDTKLDLSGWASIKNHSGKTYRDASLKLIAGDIHRAQPKWGRQSAMKGLAAAESVYSGFEEKSFFEYHMYTLPRKTTIADKENKQITLFEPAASTVDKVFIYRPERNRTKVEVAIRFINSKQSGLGIPLPGGRVRLFQADDDGSMVLLGEDIIEHTPKDEKMNLKVGYAFDITAEEQVISQNRISSKVEDMEYEIKLNNRKDEAVTVEIDKRMYGFWEIIESSHSYNKKNINTLTFEIPVEANSTETIRFIVRLSYR